MSLIFFIAAIVLFVAAGVYFIRGGQQPESLIAAGLASVAIALAIALGLQPPGPEPEPPPDDFGGYRPHYQGHGTTTPGGRGGEIRRVSNASQLAEAVKGRAGCANTPASCARIVIVETSGNYDGFGGQLTIDSPFLTLAGQTAPDDGITLINTRLLVDTHDVVIQHLKVRKPPRSLNACSIGEAGDGGDNSHIANVVFDHVTCTWAEEVNNLLVAGPGSHDVTILDSLIGEGLWPGGWGGIGAGIGYRNTVARTLFTQHWARQPIWGAPTELALLNTISYNGTDNTPGGNTLPAFYGDADGDGSAGSAGSAAIVNNIQLPGPDSGSARAFLGLSKKQASIDAGSRIYLDGNQGPGITGPSGDQQWAGTICTGTYGSYTNAATCGVSSNMRTNSPPPWFTDQRFVIIPTTEVVNRVLAGAGSRPKNRDAADNRMIADVTNRTGTHYLSVDKITIPTITAQTRACQLPADPHAVIDAVGRTRLEQYLESDPICGARRLE